MSRIRFPFRPGVPLAAPASAWGMSFDVAEPGGKPFVEEGDSAIVAITGPLEQHAGWFCDSYDAIRERVTAACASNCSRVVLRINSPGGDFAGAIELARDLRALAAANKKTLVAFTDSSALSAGYILACAASTIVVTPTAFVGSIGVWAPLVDEVARDKAMGVNVVIVASGTRKVDSNPHVAITDGAVSAMQAQVDTMASMFFDWVTEARGIPRESLESLQGSSQFGQTALNLKLADSLVNSWGLFLASPVNTPETATIEKKVPAMGKSYEEAKKASRVALEKCAAGDDEDAKKAKELLAKFDDGDGDGDEGKKEEKASDEGEDKKEALAAEEPEEKKAAARAPALRVAAASTPRELDLAARLHALETRHANEQLAVERSALLATRPDFSAEVRSSLMGADLAFVKAACKTWPRGTAPVSAAATVQGTRGETQGTHDVHPVTGMPTGFVGVSEADFIAEKMGEVKASAGVSRSGRELNLHHMTKEEAQAALAKLNAPPVAVKGNV